MAIFRLHEEPVFPDPDLAEPDGLLAVGGALTPDWLLAAYGNGIFPWFSRGTPILWWSPDPRFVLELDALHVSRSLGKTLRSGRFAVRFDSAFEEVIGRCARKPRKGQRGTWITAGMAKGYLELHRRGVAHSIEAWEGQALVGGLYGVSLGAAFFGESMFADRPDASKVALVHLVERLRAWRFELLDCQVETEHLLRLGAHSIPRRVFRERLARALQAPTRDGPWSDGAGSAIG